MSRVGKKPVPVPSDVKVSCVNNMVTIQGPKGKLDYKVDDRFKIEIKDNKIFITRPSEEHKDMSKHGLIRTLLLNNIIGVTKGYSKELEIRGVGFKALVQGKKLTLNLGYSHQIDYPIPDGITILAAKPTQLTVSGIDKAKVGEITAEIRDFYLPEPYKGKGIRYFNEYVRHKAGKTVA
ncbi:MAG: 50S ribosomal protein L6 [Candidatus Omnitrophica bacterium]|nr:50S ribosomal protein L6 [Candidatus Omnitrophota bacterium]